MREPRNTCILHEIVFIHADLLATDPFLGLLPTGIHLVPKAAVKGGRVGHADNRSAGDLAHQPFADMLEFKL
jgi:hypothetical protein